MDLILLERAIHYYARRGEVTKCADAMEALEIEKAKYQKVQS